LAKPPSADVKLRLRATEVNIISGTNPPPLSGVSGHSDFQNPSIPVNFSIFAGVLHLKLTRKPQVELSLLHG
jgi:hypothetical protein